MSFEISQPRVHLQECAPTNTNIINSTDKKKKKRWNLKGRESVALCLAFTHVV